MDRNISQKPWIVRFFYRIYGIIRAYFAFLGILVTLIGLGWGTVLYKLAKQDDSEQDEELAQFDEAHPLRLKLVVDGKVTGRSPSMGDLFLANFGQESRTISLPELRSTLLKAKNDPRISGLYIVIQHLEADAADMVEFRRILADFKYQQGKRIHCVLNQASDWNYYLASVANYITLNPASGLELSGPSFTLVYFGDALKKLGVDMEVVRAGKYKSAFEPFVANAPSEPTIEEYETIRGRLLDHMVQTIAEGRGKSPAEVHGWFKQSVFNSQAALAQGIVDRIGYDSETNIEPFESGQRVMDPGVSVKQEASVGAEQPKGADDKSKDQTPPQTTALDSISYSRYIAMTKGKPIQLPTVDAQDGIGLIEAYGEITMHQNESFMADETSISPEPLIKRLKWAGDAKYVKAVVFKINSPGGSAVASDVIWNEVRHLASLKPVVVYMGAVAASGGYYIAAPASYIVAEPTTITGSIGVIGMLPKFKEFKEKYGVSFHLIAGSDRKSLMNPGVSLTDEDRKVLESSIEATYKVFLDRVSMGRKLPLEQVSELAQGRVYSGLEAKELGLVDDIGGYQMAVRQAKTLGGLDPERLYPLHRYGDDELDFGSCLANPLKCLSNANSMMPMFDLVFAAGSSDRLPFALGPNILSSEPIIHRLKEWIVRHQAEPLTLWDQTIVIN